VTWVSTFCRGGGDDGDAEDAVAFLPAGAGDGVEAIWVSKRSRARVEAASKAA